MDSLEAIDSAISKLEDNLVKSRRTLQAMEDSTYFSQLSYPQHLKMIEAYEKELMELKEQRLKFK